MQQLPRTTTLPLLGSAHRDVSGSPAPALLLPCTSAAREYQPDAGSQQAGQQQQPEPSFEFLQALEVLLRRAAGVAGTPLSSINRSVGRAGPGGTGRCTIWPQRDCHA